MSVIGILFEKRIVDDSGFPRTPDRPVELLGTRVRYSRSVKTTIGACGPNFLGGSAISNLGTKLKRRLATCRTDETARRGKDRGTTVSTIED